MSVTSRISVFLEHGGLVRVVHNMLCLTGRKQCLGNGCSAPWGGRYQQSMFNGIAGDEGRCWLGPLQRRLKGVSGHSANVTVPGQCGHKTTRLQV